MYCVHININCVCVYIYIYIYIYSYIIYTRMYWTKKKLESETTVNATGVVHLCIREHMELMMTMGIRNL
jgi:hypothetical protein